eukprot:NODE_2_length_91304_cov_0.692462.p5 type:complete len:845 gc:universal NODE_2_length_91304_cov_0.692462:6696-9230(+)
MLSILKNANTTPAITELASKPFKAFKSLLSEICAVEDIYEAIFENSIVNTTAHPAMMLDDNGESYLWYEFDLHWHSNRKLGRKHAHQVLSLHTKFVSYLKALVLRHPDEVDGLIEIALEGSKSLYRPIRQITTLIGLHLIVSWVESGRDSTLLVDKILKKRLCDTDLNISVMVMIYLSEIYLLDSDYSCKKLNDCLVNLSSWMQSNQEVLRKTAVYVIYKIHNIKEDQLQYRLKELVERNILSLATGIFSPSDYHILVLSWAMNCHIINPKILVLLADKALGVKKKELFEMIKSYLGFSSNFHNDSLLNEYIGVCKFFGLMMYELEQFEVGSSEYDKSAFLNFYLQKFDLLIYRLYGTKFDTFVSPQSMKLNKVEIPDYLEELEGGENIPAFISEFIPLDLIVRLQLVRNNPNYFKSYFMGGTYLFESKTYREESNIHDLLESTKVTEADEEVDMSSSSGYLKFVKVTCSSLQLLTCLEVARYLNLNVQFDLNRYCSFESYLLYNKKYSPINEFSWEKAPNFFKISNLDQEIDFLHSLFSKLDKESTNMFSLVQSISFFINQYDGDSSQIAGLVQHCVNKLIEAALQESDDIHKLNYFQHVCCILQASSKLEPLELSEQFQSQICFTINEIIASGDDYQILKSCQILNLFFQCQILESDNLVVLQGASLHILKKIPDIYQNNYFDYTTVLPTFQQNYMFLSLSEILLILNTEMQRILSGNPHPGVIKRQISNLILSVTAITNLFIDLSKLNSKKIEFLKKCYTYLQKFLGSFIQQHEDFNLYLTNLSGLHRSILKMIATISEENVDLLIGFDKLLLDLVKQKRGREMQTLIETDAVVEMYLLLI